MTVHYITRENEMLDYICFKHYGYSSGAVEIVLEANPGLAAVVLKVNRKIDVAVNKYLKFVWAYLFTAMLLLYRSSFRAILLSKQSTVSY